MTTADTAGSPDDGLAVQTVGLTKRFGAQTAVDGIDLAVPRGSVFGFLGPNGSGKTTTIRMLLGLLRSTSGQARVLGEDMPTSLDAVLPRVGALVEGPAFAPFLTGEQNLRRFDAADRHSAARTRDARVAAALERVGLTHAAKKKAHAYSLGMKQRLGLANALLMPRVGALVEGPAFAPFLTGEQNLRRFDAADRHSAARTRDARVAAALERVGLAHAAKKKAHAYSLGMKQRLGLANALLMPRELLVLDEPTNGLDPQGTREVRALIRSFAADGTTVFVSSHLLAEIEQLCTHVGVMSGGRLVAQGTLDDFRGAGALPRVRVRTPDVDAARAVLAERGVTTDAGDAASDLDVVTGTLTADTVAEDLVAALVERGVRVRGFELLGQSLEQRFVQLTGEGFDVVA